MKSIAKKTTMARTYRTTYDSYYPPDESIRVRRKMSARSDKISFNGDHLSYITEQYPHYPNFASYDLEIPASGLQYVYTTIKACLVDQCDDTNSALFTVSLIPVLNYKVRGVYGCDSSLKGCSSMVHPWPVQKTSSIKIEEVGELMGIVELESHHSFDNMSRASHDRPGYNTYNMYTEYVADIHIGEFNRYRPFYIVDRQKLISKIREIFVPRP